AGARGRVHRWFEAAVATPALRKSLLVRPYSRLTPGEPGGAESRSLQHGRAVHRGTKEIGEPLHRQVARHHAAVDAQDRTCTLGPIPAHGVDEIACLIADRFQRGPGKLVRSRIAGQAEQGSAGVRVPVRCSQAGEGGDEIYILVGVSRSGHHAGLVGPLQDLEPVPQPLHRRAGDEDGAFEGISRSAVEPVGDGGKQTIRRGYEIGPCVKQGEATGAVSRFHHPRGETGLPNRGRLLVTGNAADWYRRAKQGRIDGAEFGSRVSNLRQDCSWDAEYAQQLLVPLLLPDVEQQST